MAGAVASGPSGAQPPPNEAAVTPEAGRWAYLDLPTGVAGDMLLAALFDLGLPESVVLEPLAALGLAAAFRLELQEARSAGLRGQRLQVHLLEAPPPERHWAQLRPQLEAAPWPEPLRQRVSSITFMGLPWPMNSTGMRGLGLRPGSCDRLVTGWLGADALGVAADWSVGMANVAPRAAASWKAVRRCMV